MKVKGTLKYSVDDHDSEIEPELSKLVMTKELEKYSTAQLKEDDDEYRTTHELDTEEGKFIFETITSNGVNGLSTETEIIKQPDNIEIIEVPNFFYEKEEEE